MAAEGVGKCFPGPALKVAAWAEKQKNKGRKQFFFEKKNQKTFEYFMRRLDSL